MDGFSEIKGAVSDLADSTTEALARIGTRLGTAEREAKAAKDTADRLETALRRVPASARMSQELGDGAPEYKALGQFVRTADDTELKALSVGSDPDGGYLVHPVLSATMTRRLFDLTPMRRLARTVTIGAAGGSFEEPIDHDESGAEWVGEREERPDTGTPRLGVLSVPVHEIYAMQTVTQRLVDDAGINVGQWVEGKIADKFARSEASATVNGDGLAKPRGFLSCPTAETADLARPWGTLQHVKSGSASAVTPDSLRDLVWSLRAPYRQGATWLMNSATANAIDKLKNGNGDYLWRDGMTAGASPALLGYPVEFSEDMPDIAAGAFPIAFGNWQLGYLIVDKPGIKYLRDPYKAMPNLLFYAYRRTGGDVSNSDALKLLKISA